ncbi:DUF4153 domain-containing protein [Paenibacillus sp. GP183]|jgi:hypothetical protein|uniref:DUF4153 domain-containing protein n=1 Tax=Paenibacillus sp. GP183 TaxID=1882751 RepID=UPI00089A56F7|nr:DUF4173 domain-containing protein [Paenibacillus sp. GP183]SEB40209.1 protein of unknown function [Paenibacillus sp. GP183]
MRDPAPWLKKYNRMLLFACLLGLISQYLFVGKAAGISVVLFVIGFYGTFFYAVRGRLGGFEKWKGQANIGWLLLLPVGLLSMTYTLYANDFFRVLNALALPLLVVVQTMWITRNKVHNWRGLHFFRTILSQSAAQPLKNLNIPFSLIRSSMPSTPEEKSSSTWSRMRKVLIGLILALPFLFIVVALLASADSIFQSWIEGISNLFKGVSFGDLILRVFVALLVSLYTFTYLWGLLFPKVDKVEKVPKPIEYLDSFPEEGVQIERVKISLDPIIAGTLFVCVNVVYVLFAGIQFSYLFGAAKGLLPEGAAYAEYARRGFAELVMAALINMGLLLVGLHGIRRSGAMAEMIRKLLMSILVGCTVIMLVSAYSRLSLYESAYGYTLTRLLVHGFMLFLGVLLIITLLRIWWEHFSLLKAYLLSAVVAYVLMNYANLDDRIASNNIARYEQSGVIDIPYLGMLSTDAYPALLQFQAKHPEILSLKPYLDEMRDHQSQYEAKWPSWNLSKMRAR